MSQTGSMVRCSSSIAQPSVTALSPSRFSSTVSDDDVCAKCSVWPASWKSARQSSGPPCGLITRITRPGISIGHAERARRLVRPLLEVELDVLLRAQVDAEVGERPLERRHHPVLRKRVVPRDAAPDARDVPALDLAEPEPDARAERPVAGLLPHPLRRVEEVAALLGQSVEVEAEAAVELGVARRAEPLGLAVDDLRGAEVERVHLGLRQLVAGELEPFARRPVGLVADARAEHPVRHLLAVDGRLQRRLQLGHPLRLLADEVAEIALAGELPELAGVAAAVDRRAERERGVERGQLGVPLVDRHEVVAVLDPGEVEVRLLVELGDEAVGLGAEPVELPLAERLCHGGP